MNRCECYAVTLMLVNRKVIGKCFACTEINFIWAGHQAHHSSEDYNYTTALRQSVFQKYSSWVSILP